MIEIEVTKEVAERIVEQMENEATRMDNTLNSFRGNNIGHTDAYKQLEAEKEDLEIGIENIQEQIDEQAETDDDELAELFG